MYICIYVYIHICIYVCSHMLLGPLEYKMFTLNNIHAIPRLINIHVNKYPRMDRMDIYGHIWTYWNIYGHIRTYTDMYGHIWTYMDIYGHT